MFINYDIVSAYLRPSRELLEYYRKKIAEFDNEHDEMVQKLEQYRMTYEEQVCHCVKCIIIIIIIIIIIKNKKKIKKIIVVYFRHNHLTWRSIS